MYVPTSVAMVITIPRRTSVLMKLNELNEGVETADVGRRAGKIEVCYWSFEIAYSRPTLEASRTHLWVATQSLKSLVL